MRTLTTRRPKAHGQWPSQNTRLPSWAFGRGPLACSVAAAVLIAASLAVPGDARQATPSSPLPVAVFETAKGTFEIQFFQAEAPKSVAQIVALVKRGFYRGQRFHRVTPVLAQVGDPRSRDMTYREHWGSGGSGKPINAFEWSKKRLHVRGAVGLAHSGNPMAADSQIYIMKAASPSLDGQHAVIGQVTVGMAVVDKLQVPDAIKNVSLKGAGPK